MSKRVEEFFHAPIPQGLWHYTSIAGFGGILSSGRMWATEARFTNDKTEYIFAQKVAVDYLKSLSASDGFAREAIEDLLRVIQSSYLIGVLSPKFADVFVVSFSATEDLKSQWSEYADAYRGVSIAFDLTRIRPPLETDTSITFAPCIYELSEQERLIQSAVGRFMVHVDALRNDFDQNLDIKRTWQIVQRIYGEAAGEPPYHIRTDAEIHKLLKRGVHDMNRDLFVLTSHCKNPKFKEEDEWRLVLPRSRKKDSARYSIKHRDKEWEGEFVKVPYIEVGLDTDEERLPITAVMVGPKCDPVEVRSILDRYDYKVPIVASQVPVR